MAMDTVMGVRTSRRPQVPNPHLRIPRHPPRRHPRIHTSGRGHSRRPGPLGMLAQRVVSASASDGQLLLVKHRLGSVLPLPEAIEAARADPSQFLVLRLQRVLASGVLVTAECEQLAGAHTEQQLDAAGRRRVMLHRAVCEHALQARCSPTHPACPTAPSSPFVAARRLLPRFPAVARDQRRPPCAACQAAVTAHRV